MTEKATPTPTPTTSKTAPQNDNVAPRGVGPANENPDGKGVINQPSGNTVQKEAAEETTSDSGTLVVQGEVKRQLIGEPRDASPVTPVYEYHRKLDRVILDTSDPLAVQPGPKDAEPNLNPQTPEEKLAEQGKE